MNFSRTFRIIQSIFEEEDDFNKPTNSAAHVKKLLLDYFELDDKVGILQYLYANFDKSKIAAFTEKVARGKILFFRYFFILGCLQIWLSFDERIYSAHINNALVLLPAVLFSRLSAGCNVYMSTIENCPGV